MDRRSFARASLATAVLPIATGRHNRLPQEGVPYSYLQVAGTTAEVVAGVAAASGQPEAGQSIAALIAESAYAGLRGSFEAAQEALHMALGQGVMLATQLQPAAWVGADVAPQLLAGAPEFMMGLLRQWEQDGNPIVLRVPSEVLACLEERARGAASCVEPAAWRVGGCAIGTAPLAFLSAAAWWGAFLACLDILLTEQTIEEAADCLQPERDRFFECLADISR